MKSPNGYDRGPSSGSSFRRRLPASSSLGSSGCTNKSYAIHSDCAYGYNNTGTAIVTPIAVGASQSHGTSGQVATRKIAKVRRNATMANAVLKITAPTQ